MRSHATRGLHLLLLVVVLEQLIGSQIMQRPLPGDDPSWVFALHEYAGLASLAVIAGFWVWTLVRRGETRLVRLLPWFSAAAIRAVIADLAEQGRRLVHGRVPDDEDGALASATHGLGLLTVTAMAGTGAVYYFAAGTPVSHAALTLHKLVANLMWAYLVAHAGVAVLHALLGSDILSRMFWIGRARPTPPSER